MKDDVIAPVARGTARGSEKLAEGSEALADGVRKIADKTQQIADKTQQIADKTQDWADEMTGARRRRNLVWLVLAITVVGLVLYLVIRSDED